VSSGLEGAQSLVRGKGNRECSCWPYFPHYLNGLPQADETTRSGNSVNSIPCDSWNLTIPCLVPCRKINLWIP